MTDELAPDEVRVRARAMSLNRADLASLAAFRKSDGKGRPPGGEWSGDVLGVGASVTHVKPGDRVMCSGPGGFAEIAVTDRGRVAPIPDGMDYAEAATLPIGLMTMHDALVTHGHAGPGMSVVIQGASSGVGIIGLQIARLLGCDPVIGAARRIDRLSKLAEFGATSTVDTSDPEWPRQVMAATNGHGAELIVDMVSGSAMAGNLVCAGVLGRIVNVGRLGGGKAEFDFDLHALKRISYIGVTFRTRSLQEVRDLSDAMFRDLGAHIASGQIVCPIDRVLPLSDLDKAFDAMRGDEHFGKIIVTV